MPPQLKPLPRGVQLFNMARSIPPPAGVQTVIAGRTNEITWAKLQPEPGIIDTTLIDNIIKYADSAGIPHVGIRIFCGMEAPDWLKAIIGSFPYYNPHDKGGTNTEEDAKPCVKFWTPAYLAYFESLWAKLAEKYDNHPKVTHIYNVLGMTRHAEPMQRGISSDFVVQSFRTAGYTFAQDYAAQVEALKIHRRWWYRTRLATAFNPWQDVEARKTRIDATLRLMAAQADILGEQGMYQNNGLRQSFIGGDAGNMTTLYNEMISYGNRGYPIGWQTATDDAVGDLQACVEWACEQGGIVFEPGSSFIEKYDDNYRISCMKRLADNTERYPTTLEKLDRLQRDYSNVSNALTEQGRTIAQLNTVLAERENDITSLKEDYRIRNEEAFTYQQHIVEVDNTLRGLVEKTAPLVAMLDVNAPTGE